MSSLFNRVGTIFNSVFDYPAEKFTAETVPDDVTRWDSLGHISLVSALQAEFGIELELDEIMEMVSGAKIVEVLEAKGIKAE